MSHEESIQQLCRLPFLLLRGRRLQPEKLQSVGVLLQGFLLPGSFFARDEHAVFAVSQAVANEPAVENEPFQRQGDAEEEAGEELQGVSFREDS